MTKKESIDLINLSREILSKGKKVLIPKIGSSMYPVFKKDDSILIEPIAGRNVSAGDILVFHPDGSKRMTAHRLMKIYYEDGRKRLITKGDTFPHFDRPIFLDMVLGKVVAVERKGRLLMINKGLCGIINILFFKLSPLSRWIYPPLRGMRSRINKVKDRYANRKPVTALSAKAEL